MIDWQSVFLSMNGGRSFADCWTLRCVHVAPFSSTELLRLLSRQ
jgi:hypothetical protein